MNFQEIGEALKQERQRQGLSVDDVFQKTKISPSTLQHIEEGRIEELPHPVYAKGFVKNYAHLLGLDAEEFARLFEQNIAQQEIIGDEQDITEGGEVAAPEPKGRPWTFVSLLLTVILLGVLGWLSYDVFLKAPQTGSDQGGGNQAAAVNSTGEAAGDSGSESSLRGNGTNVLDLQEQRNASSQNSNRTGTGASADERAGSEAEMNQTGRVAETSAQETQTVPSAAGGEMEPTEESSALDDEPAGTSATRAPETGEVETGRARGGNETAQAADVSGHTLEISAVEACWFKANVDNNVRDIFLRPGESVVLHFERSLEVKLGNAGGVRLRYNGEAYPLDAESGEVATVTLP